MGQILVALSVKVDYRCLEVKNQTAAVSRYGSSPQSPDRNGHVRGSAGTDALPAQEEAKHPPGRQSWSAAQV